MLLLLPPTRKRSTRVPFLQPVWDDQHPDFLRLDADLPADDHARWLLLAVSRLDLTPLRRAYANRGSLAYPPEQLLPFVLLMYSKKLISPAEWARQARSNDAAKWLLRGLRPSRSALYTFRDRTEPFLDAWHKQLIDWAVAEKITAGDRGSLDGSFIAALSSRHRLLSRRVLDGRLLLLSLAVWVDKHPSDEVQTAIGVLLARASTFPADGPLCLRTALQLLLLLLLRDEAQAVRDAILPCWLPHSAAGRERMLMRYEKAQQRLAERLRPYQGKKRLSTKDEKAIKRAKINPTDSEAALGWDKVGTYRPLYNLQVVKATDAPLILAWELYSSNNDEGMLRPMMQKTETHLGRHLNAAIVDGGYVSIGDLLYCEKQGITVYAPPAKEDKSKTAAVASTPQTASATEQDNRRAAVAVAGPQPPSSTAGTQPEQQPSRTVGGGSEQAGAAQQTVVQDAAERAGSKEAKAEKKYPKEMFRYDGQAKVYHCPAGKVLKEVFRTSEKRQGGMELTVLVHRAAAADCQGCAERDKCMTGKKGRVVKRYEGEEVLERLEQRMKEPGSKEIYRERGQTVELGYADLKEHRGLRVFRCFGKKRSRAQAGLTILASNALGIVRALRRRERETAPPSHRQKQAC
jgi:transposase